MASIIDYQERIQNEKPEEQFIEVGIRPSKMWKEYIDVNEDVKKAFETLRKNDKDVLIISREDVFKATTPVEKIIKALIWGYPKGMRGKKNLRSILGFSNDIAQLLTEYQKRQPLSSTEYIDLYNDLTDISGLKQSTVSKLLYFFKISVGINPLMIVDNNVVAAFQAFDEFTDASFESENANRYLKQVKKINAIAHKLHCKPDQLELFLFEFGKHWRIKKNDLVKQCIEKMNQK